MTKPEDIGWGRYNGYEGPFYRGKHPYLSPKNPTAACKIIEVITATEGGAYDAFNGYDSCGWTSGVIQWCERSQFSVSDMLSEVADYDPDLIRPFTDYAKEQGLEFVALLTDKVRRLRRKGRPLDGPQQVDLFWPWGKSPSAESGNRPKYEAYAKGWAAAISTVWENPEAQAIQLEYTAKRVWGFMPPDMLPAIRRLHEDGPWGAAFTAGYLSFAANNPARAAQYVRPFLGADNVGTAYWVSDVLQGLATDTGVSIYPHRYEQIRPVIDRIYGVALPALLGGKRNEWDVVELQAALRVLGFDLGPKGVDGAYGPKTRAAVAGFQVSAGIPPTGDLTHETQEAIEHKLAQARLPDLTWPLEVP